MNIPTKQEIEEAASHYIDKHNPDSRVSVWISACQWLLSRLTAPNGEFIAASRTDIPALLDHIESLEGKLKVAEEALVQIELASPDSNVGQYARETRDDIRGDS